MFQGSVVLWIDFYSALTETRGEARHFAEPSLLVVLRIQADEGYPIQCRYYGECRDKLQGI